MPVADADAGASAYSDSIGPRKQYESIHPTNSGDVDEELDRRESHASSRSQRSLDHVVSLTDGYSHHAVDHDTLQEPTDEEEPKIEPDTEFIVQWDGPHDPDNPRNIPLMRRWLIVLVLATGSLCVYVDIPSRTPITYIYFQVLICLY